MTDIYNRWQLEEAISPEKLIPAIEEGFIAYSQGKGGCSTSGAAIVR